MNSWFAKFRISAAHDANKPCSAALRRKIAASEELRRFEQNVAGLEHALKASRPEPQVPPALHHSIMGALQAAPSAQPQQNLKVLRWLPAPALAALALGAWFLFRPSTPPAPPAAAQSLVALSTALDAGEQLVRAMPNAMVAPLSEELERLNQDIDNTAQFLLASVP